MTFKYAESTVKTSNQPYGSVEGSTLLHTCLVVLIHCCFALSVVVDVVRLLLSLSAVAVS